ncbi:hypothetical protein ACFX2I_037628 [Malus domestica]
MPSWLPKTLLHHSSCLSSISSNSSMFPSRSSSKHPPWWFGPGSRWFSSLTWSRGRGNYQQANNWGPQPNVAPGVLGAPPAFWCTHCNSPGNHLTACPHHLNMAPCAGFQAFIASVLPAPHKYYDPTWYIDTGSTHHMTVAPCSMSKEAKQINVYSMSSSLKLH